MQQFDAIFEIFGRTFFEAIEVKGRSRLNFEAGCQPRKSKTDLCMINGSKVLIY